MGESSKNINMSLTTKKILPLAILLVVIALFVYYISKNISSFRNISIVNPSYIIISIIILIISYYVIGIVTKVLLEPFKIRMSNKEAFKLSIVTGFYNLITPFRGGMAVRAVYLKKKHEFPYTEFLATLAAAYILIFLVGSILGMLSIGLIHYTTGLFSWQLLIVFGAVFLPLLLVIIFSPRFPEAKNKWLNRFVRVINGWHLIKNNKKVIYTTIFRTFVQLILSAISVYYAFRVFGINIDFIKCLFLSAVGNISLLVSITPANLGVSEAIQVFSGLTIGITPAQSLAMAILGRIVSFLVLGILGPIYSYQLMKEVKKKEE